MSEQRMQNKELRKQNLLLEPTMVMSFVFCILFSAFCFGKTAAVKNPVFEIDKVYQKGPVTAHIRVDKSKITIAQTLTVDVETATGSGYEVNLPQIGKDSNSFGLLDKQNLGQHLDANNNVVSTTRYRLEPLVTGKLTIPAFTLEFHDTGPASPKGFAEAGKTYELITEPIDIEVTSLLGQQAGKVAMSDIEDVVGMRGKSVLWWILPAVVVIAAAAWLWRHLRKKKNKAAIRIYKPAHEIAYAKLQALINRDLLKLGKVKEFYEGVSDVLRHYIEDRFELRAPERTTEEFLAEIRDTGVLTEDHRKALVEFLTHCDLVKFAKHSPTGEQTQRTIDLAKNFIEQTKSDERKIDVTDWVAGSVAVPFDNAQGRPATAKHLAGGI
jgi:hypothetical protein